MSLVNGRNLTRLLTLASVALALAAPQPLGAQFGGLGRRIAEGAKKAAGVESAEAPTPGAPKPVVLPDDDPTVIPITDTVLEGFARTLQTEIDLRDQLFKELEAKEAAEKKYTACKQQAAASPEFMQILTRLADAPENASTEEMMKRMAQMSQDQEALVVKIGDRPHPQVRKPDAVDATTHRTCPVTSSST
jgi:hypothetical protein